MNWLAKHLQSPRWFRKNLVAAWVSNGWLVGEHDRRPSDLNPYAHHWKAKRGKR